MEPFLVSTGLVALAEIGDKTQLLSFMLAARYKRPWPICWGILVATALNHAMASAVGAWVAGLVAPTTLRWILAVSFVAMAAWMLAMLAAFAYLLFGEPMSGSRRTQVRFAEAMLILPMMWFVLLFTIRRRGLPKRFMRRLCRAAGEAAGAGAEAAAGSMRLSGSAIRRLAATQKKQTPRQPKCASSQAISGHDTVLVKPAISVTPEIELRAEVP